MKSLKTALKRAKHDEESLSRGFSWPSLHEDAAKASEASVPLASASALLAELQRRAPEDAEVDLC